jgi:hypothetical protein
LESEVRAVKPLLIDFLVGTVKDFNIILETRYKENCFIPVKLFLASCSEETEVTDDVLFIISKADELEYHHGCVYIIFNVSYISEIRNILRIISEKLGYNFGELISLKDHAFVEVDED